MTRRECWFLTGSQGLCGPENLEQVASQSAAIARKLDASPDLAVPVRFRPVLTSSDAIRRVML